MAFLVGMLGSRVNSRQPPATALRVQSSVNGQPIPIVHGQQRVASNLLWYGNFNYQSGSGKGGGKGSVTGGGGGKGGGQGGTTYYASFAAAQCEGPIDGILLAWSNKTPAGLATNGFVAFDGYQGQTPWSYLTSNDPSQSLGYSSLGYTAVANLNLGNSPELPNMTWEVRSAIANAVTETYSIGSPYTFTPTYWSLAASVTETILVPGAPYQYQAQGRGAVNSFPVASGAIPGTGNGVISSTSSGVLDSLGNVFARVASGPTTGQYAVHVTTDANYGLYTFAAADVGKQITIVDFAVAPGVNFIYQPTGNNTSGQSTITSLSSATNLSAGQLVTGTGIQPGTVCTGISGSTATLSQVTTAGTTGGTYTFWGAQLTQVLPPGTQYYAGTATLITAPALVSGQFCVLATPSHYGQYQFAAADNGKKVGIIDVPDADPSQSLTDFLSNPRYGVGFPAANIGSLTTLQSYTFANGMFISPVIAASQSANGYLKSFSDGLNGEFVWSGGLLTWMPYGDTSATGYGKTYTAPSAPIYSLGDDDFLKSQGTSSVGVSAFTSDDPVICVRTRPSDAYNSIKTEYLDRGNSYNPAIFEAKDDAAINSFGLRPQDTKQLHMFAFSNAAQTSTHLQLGRQQVRNKYTVTVPWYFILLDPMDVIALTDSSLGLNQQWVRILEITENQQDSSLTMTVEEFLGGTGSTPLYGAQVKAGATPSYNLDPGPPLATVIFEAPIGIATNSGLETWLSTCGGPNWGGADVWVSRDNSTYKLLERYQGSSRVGALNADFPSHSDPDTSSIIDVILASQGELLSGNSNSDADLGHTLCYVGASAAASGPFELVSYLNSTFISGSEYELGTYIRRGQYGTTIQDHPNGSSFARLDGTQFAFPYDKSQIGQVVYIKLLSFNLWGGGQPTLDAVNPIAHTIIGPPLPSNVTGFNAVQVGTAVAFMWDAVTDFGLKGIDILYGSQSGTIASAIFLTEAGKGTEMTNAAVPPGSWTFYAQARDIADQVSATPATYNLTVTNVNNIIGQQVSEPLWAGSDNGNIVRHPTGTITLKSQQPPSYWPNIANPANNYLVNIDNADGPVVPLTYYVQITLLTGNNSSSPTAETLPSTEISVVLTLPNQIFEVFTSGLSPAPDANAAFYNVYVGTSPGSETLQNLTPIALTGAWGLPTTGITTTGRVPPTHNNTGFEPFDVFVPLPANGSYGTPTIDAGYVGSVRAWNQYNYALGPGETISPDITTAIDVDSVYQQPWVNGYIIGRNFFGVILFGYGFVPTPLDPGNIPYIKDYTFTVDAPQVTESGGPQTIAPGGTTVTYPSRFHVAPYVQATVVGTTALTAAVSTIGATTFFCQVFDHTGSDVGGTINWTAVGE